jgi:5-(carboxyamino)imidazole ribonucleotide synthase
MGVIDAVDAITPVHPGRVPLAVTQDRLEERRFVERAGIGVAPWRAVATSDDLRRAAAELGFPLRLKAATGGYDGRSQIRLATVDDLDTALERLGRPTGMLQLVEREIEYAAEISVVIARGPDGRSATFPVARNVHDAGILAESVAPAPIPAEVAERAAAVAERLALAMGLTGTLTAELFLIADGAVLVNELAPRVHNSGHWTLDGAATSQFEQHIRAICGLQLGATDALAPTAMVNLLGRGPSRPARLVPASLGEALSDATVHLHLYDKRRVFERRKMGHVTATADSIDEALDRARTAVDRLCWAEGDA